MNDDKFNVVVERNMFLTTEGIIFNFLPTHFFTLLLRTGIKLNTFSWILVCFSFSVNLFHIQWHKNLKVLFR